MQRTHTVEFNTLSAFKSFSGGFEFVVGPENVSAERAALSGFRTDGVRGGTVTVQTTEAEFDFMISTIRNSRQVATDTVKVDGEYLTKRRRKGGR